MTFSIAAYGRSRQEGAWGVAVASKFTRRRGDGLPWVRAGAGAVATPILRQDRLWTRRSAGWRPASARKRRYSACSDLAPGKATRQVGIIKLTDAPPRTPGVKCEADQAGHRIDVGCCQGNILTGPEVLDPMALPSAPKVNSPIGCWRRNWQVIARAATGAGGKAALYVAKTNGGYGGGGVVAISTCASATNPDPVARLNGWSAASHLFWRNAPGRPPADHPGTGARTPIDHARAKILYRRPEQPIRIMFTIEAFDRLIGTEGISKNAGEVLNFHARGPRGAGLSARTLRPEGSRQPQSHYSSDHRRGDPAACARSGCALSSG
ncbi:MAG: DUF1028 domain-containing protein, partial [Chloroflexi bacterium]|nr:DUF1028 domain-containing protein [Chloroflexota bacterium]